MAAAAQSKEQSHNAAYLTIGSYFLGIAIKMWAKAKGIVMPFKKRKKKSKTGYWSKSILVILFITSEVNLSYGLEVYGIATWMKIYLLP